jgi:membrane protein CcdC involved in cytochrome C biogenesis
MVFPSGTAVLTSVVGLAAVLAWRVQEARSFSMFAFPAFRIPWTWAGIALLIGAVGLAYPLLLTSRLVRQADVVMMQRSNAFFTVILGLAAIRLLARGYLDTVLSLQQTGAVFYLLAFGMIVRWRARMFLEYRKLTCEHAAESADPR